MIISRVYIEESKSTTEYYSRMLALWGSWMIPLVVVDGRSYCLHDEKCRLLYMVPCKQMIFLAVSVTRLLANLTSPRTHISTLFPSFFTVVNVENLANLSSPFSFPLSREFSSSSALQRLKSRFSPSLVSFSANESRRPKLC